MTQSPNFAFVSFVRAAVRKRWGRAGALQFLPLAGDGSDRTFWRVAQEGAPASLVAMANPPDTDFRRRENRAYLLIGNHLHAKGVRVAGILAHDLARGWFLLEDLGGCCLQERVMAADDPLPLYRLAVEELLRFQVEGFRGFDPDWCCQTRAYDLYVMRRLESDYFTRAFLRGYLGMSDVPVDLETAFDYLAKQASRAPARVLIHRDFQSRNLIIDRGRVGIVDWQGARIGPPGYDLASLLIDPYCPRDENTTLQILKHYKKGLRDREARLLEHFEDTFPYLAIQRNLQILGAFSFLARRKGKGYFEAYIPSAVFSLQNLLRQVADPCLWPLRRVVEAVPRHYRGEKEGRKARLE